MSLCLSGHNGEHRWEWVSTFDGGGYWRCVNANCGETTSEDTGHNGG